MKVEIRSFTCFSNILIFGLSIFLHFYTNILIPFSHVFHVHHILGYLKLPSLILRTPQNLTWFAINRIYVFNKRFWVYHHISCVHISAFGWILFKIKFNGKGNERSENCKDSNQRQMQDLEWQRHCGILRMTYREGKKKRWSKNRRLGLVKESGTTQMKD